MNAVRTYAVVATLLFSSAAMAQQGTVADPSAMIAGKSRGLMSAAAFRAQIGPFVGIKGGGIEAERFQVTSFNFTVVTKRGERKGPYSAINSYGTRFSDNKEIVDAMKYLVPGDSVYIEEIKAVGRDGRKRSINSIELLLN